MKKFILVIANKKYSSWSLRPWVLMKYFGIPFSEIKIYLRKENTAQLINEYSGAGKVPILIDGKLKVWESLAICEYLAEQFPKKNMWPKDPSARAVARSVSNEMHSGFLNLRKNMPMNCRPMPPIVSMDPDVKKEFQRILEIWNDCRKKYGKKGEFLFGDFSIADCMFAPVCIRFLTYQIKLDPVSENYKNAILALPAMKEWLEDGRKESEIIDAYERK